VSDGDRPNILVMWGDDIGISNLSCYSDGLMGYRTSNIDRIADEGMRFTDYYGEQSCTAGRSAFITGQSVFRTGLSKVGLPGADLGLRAEDPTIAELLKPWGTRPASSARTTWATRTCPTTRQPGTSPTSASASAPAGSSTATPTGASRTPAR
jgi:arylsulfatase A-like enzyme